jgi:hypothetical protein
MRPIKLTVFATLTAFAITTAGCNGDATGGMMPGPAGPSDPAAPNNPDSPNNPNTPNTPAAPVAHYSGIYDAVAPIDFTQNGVLPGLLGPALGGLAQLHDHPGNAIITVVEAAGIPYLSAILMKVPSFLKAALSGLLDDLIIKNLYQGYPVVDEIASVIQGIAELGKKLEIHDEITVRTPTATGVVALEQQLTGVGFTLLGKHAVVDFSAAAKLKALAKMPGVLAAHPNAPIADADLTLGAGTFSLPIGELLLQAAGPLLFSQFGGATTLKGALGNLVPCMTFGQTLSDGVGGFISVADAQKFCTGAIGLIADQVEGKIKAIAFDGVEVERGAAKLYDVSQLKPSMDHQSDRVAEGTWTWKFTVGSTVTSVPSTFSGDRVADAQ